MTKTNKALKGNLLAVWASGTEEAAIGASMLHFEATLIYPQCDGTCDDGATLVCQSCCMAVGKAGGRIDGR